jgi:hypothetical protein
VIPLAHNPPVAKAGIAVCSLLVIALTAWKCWRASTRGQCDLAFSVCIIAMLLVSPITWDHYFLMLALPFAVMWKTLPATRLNRWGVIAAIVVLCIVYPKWLWDVTIPGDGELVTPGPGITVSVAETWHAYTLIAYQFYALSALFIFSLIGRSRRDATNAAPYVPDPLAS